MSSMNCIYEYYLNQYTKMLILFIWKVLVETHKSSYLDVSACIKT